MNSPRPRTVERTYPDRRGFTLVELEVTSAIISILTAIAIPNFQNALFKARAVDAVADLEVLRVAVVSCLTDTSEWPPARRRGRGHAGRPSPIPARRLQLQQRGLHAQLRQLDDSQPLFHRRYSGDGTNPELGAAVVDLLGPNAWTNGTFKFTWIIK